jgi:hypothetical protein
MVTNVPAAKQRGVSKQTASVPAQQLVLQPPQPTSSPVQQTVPAAQMLQLSDAQPYLQARVIQWPVVSQTSRLVPLHC